MAGRERRRPGRAAAQAHIVSTDVQSDALRLLISKQKDSFQGILTDTLYMLKLFGVLFTDGKPH